MILIDFNGILINLDTALINFNVILKPHMWTFFLDNFSEYNLKPQRELVYKLAGFSNKQNLDVRLSSQSPLSSNQSVFTPKENYNLIQNNLCNFLHSYINELFDTNKGINKLATKNSKNRKNKE